ncbi:MAG: pilus assembly protein [Dehalococcoidia bacterium]
MTKIFKRFMPQLPAREEGQGLVEYALVLGVIVVLFFLAFQTIDIEGGIGTVLGNLASHLV